MRLSEAIGLFRYYLEQSIIIFGILVFLFVLFYFFFGKNLKEFSFNRIVIHSLFIIYIIMLLIVTLLSRGRLVEWGTNYSIVGTYRQAWNSYNNSNFLNIYLSIFIFIPLGIMVPLVFDRIKTYWKIVLVSFTLSSLIESLQLVFNLGIFDVADIIHNVVGGIIGYGLLRSAFSIIHKHWRMLILHLLPLLMIVGCFYMVNVYYQKQLYGNLAITYINKYPMDKVELSSNLHFNEIESTAIVYKAPSVTKEEAKGIVIDLFKSIQLNEEVDLDMKTYTTNGYYWNRESSDYRIWFNYLDGSYSVTNFDKYLKVTSRGESTEEQLKEQLQQIQIDIPDNVPFIKVETGIYEWRIVNQLVDSQLVNGTLRVETDFNGNIIEINNCLITYEKVREEKLISNIEAMNRLKEGKFYFYQEQLINKLEVKELIVDYFLDSKGYYQPVYKFKCIVDGEERDIIIPALK